MSIYESHIRIHEQHSSCANSKISLHRVLRSCYTIRFFPRDTTCQSIEAQPKSTQCTQSLRCNTMRCAAMHCTALPPNNNGAVRGSQNYTHASITHEPKSQRAYANALDKDSPPPHNRPNNQAQSTTTLPVTNGQSKRKNNPCDRIPSLLASLQQRRVTSKPTPQSHSLPVCARSDTTSCTCTSLFSPNAHPLHHHR
jgi:hypothetical protein